MKAETIRLNLGSAISCIKSIQNEKLLRPQMQKVLIEQTMLSITNSAVATTGTLAITLKKEDTMLSAGMIN